MSYITRTGNLTEAPTLRTGESGPYTYARVAVSDRIRQEDGSYVDGPAVFYDVAVGGSQATNLVEAAERSGNIRITFSGRYRVTEYKGEQGTRIQHEVRADEVSVSLRGQSVAVERSARADERETDTY
ncbi:MULTISPECIES: single-stranded DNA-binding protein [Actinomycetes]|jgi:single-strand DNA-binding protein|uniref:Single-stranded DNA-binding protein n=1 Tax=Arsenicicoccus bolidensis TaxID=229480 RepID=A0ABS9Q5B8_9MICO|nr:MULTISPECIES: single-stranded DNA-binding protein [Actinomycetes]HOB80962.1 single-stranded DNA-binding protein [Ornithinibacter sp.]MCG7322557.1 single-stranded DNA-binding protein [Arsenicicoccus bolidensis]MCT1806174.1 single-stranded DNA-binding protein [Corynebacterium sanguinis]MCT2159494.1 single-stranded DNA-binding protein [Corynebacterium sanguinis]QOT24001.1 single-stranded DNA-binding protein [Paenarthrobacter sp. YJN-D]